MHTSFANIASRWSGAPFRLVVLPERKVIVCGVGTPLVDIEVDRATLAKVIRDPWYAFADGYASGTIVIKGDLSIILEGAYGALDTARHGHLRRMLSVTASVVNRWLATKQIGTHYDVGNEFFQRWLDPSMTYSCAYFQSTEDDLQKAQLQKLELVCQKACLQKGHHILDIGCGWGSFVAHAAVNHGVTAMGVTLSREQQEFATLAVRGIPGVSIELRDWRQVEGRFDRIVSIGMLEHLGGAQYAAFFRRWQQLLSLHGMGVVHFIGRSRAAPDSRWIRQHIFPGGYLPTLAEVVSCVSDAGFVVVDVENLWQHYIRTLACWAKQFGNQQEWIVRQFDARFYRAWWLYLKGSQAAFQCGDLQLFQVVIAKGKPKAWPLQRQIFSGSVSTSSTA